MERQTYTNTNRYLFLFLIALMVSCSKNDVQIAKSLNKEIAIYPDYKDVTIPVNIAPLNFSIADSSEHCLIIKGEKTQLQVYSDEGLFEIPQKRWKALLKENAGNQIELTIAKRIQGEWNAYTPFHMDIVNDSIDKYIAYRLLALSNDMWNRMGIYQRNLENYDQSVIYENSLTDYNCVNCHTFSFSTGASSTMTRYVLIPSAHTTSCPLRSSTSTTVPKTKQARPAKLTSGNDDRRS